MTDQTQLREKLRKLEALFAGAGTPGEKQAAEAGLERIRARLAELEQSDPAIEMQFSLPDVWSRKLFLALCRRYGLKPYRLARQRATTVMRKRRLRLIDFASVRSLTWLRERFLQQTEGWHGEWCRRICPSA